MPDTEASNNAGHWKHYYQTVKHNPHRPLVGSAAESNLSQSRLAVDCGCGTGSEIAFLLGQGYRVEAFDINPDAIQVCRERFAGNPEVNLHLSSFEDYHYPQAGLVIANSSLFFCNPQSILQVWSDIEKAICPGGVFCGDFLGMKDSWVGGSFPKVAPLSPHQIEKMFESFEILKWVERDEAGHTAGGAEKHWHSFTIVARKS
ncbi:hypothetical protein BTA51_00995 [Hahella sp. CCB-MM4]|nr:hypothetical protein BTA51_00995 [Hahella sp. CCB-MM4]